jgi:hypothetical protein
MFFQVCTEFNLFTEYLFEAIGATLQAPSSLEFQQALHGSA